MTNPGLTDSGLLFAHPASYIDMQAWHVRAAEVRRHDPVVPVEIEGFEPFWVLTRHKDVFAVSRDNQRWLNTSRAVLEPDSVSQHRKQAGIPEPSMLIHLDGRRHRDMRAIANDWFKPAAIKHRQPRVDEIADLFVGKLHDLGGHCDFATDIAVPYTLRVIMDIYGIPESDEALMAELTKGITGAADRELGGDRDPAATVQASILSFIEYFANVTADRQAHPTDDLASVIANGQIEGCPIDDAERVWYYMIFATAGHDTTSFGLTGGLEALLSQPEQWQILSRSPELLLNATDEMIRWTSPVRHFMRYAVEDSEILGVKVPAGGRVMLSYPSANRDEDVFNDPMTFDVARPDANRLLAFGVGGHFCLGAQLARREICTLIGKLTQELDHIELAGDPEWSEGHLVSGVKHLPIAYTFS